VQAPRSHRRARSAVSTQTALAAKAPKTLPVKTVSATMTGKAVPTKSSPAKGSPTASGHIVIKLDPNTGTAC
jgi:hypothetical protein